MEGKIGVLEKLKKNSILATDIASQFWCELQMELNYIHGKEYTKAMAGGAKVHKALEKEAHVAIEAEPQGYADFLYKEAYENYLAYKSLNEKGIGREIKVYGSINGFKVSGKIDELKVKDGKVVIVETKTKSLNAKLDGSNVKEIKETTMRTHKVQIMVYKKLLEDLWKREYTYQNFYTSYGIGKMLLSEKFLKQLELLSIPEEMRNLNAIYGLMFEQLYKIPQVSDTLIISYVDRATGEEFASVAVEYNKDDFDKTLKDIMGYWLGERTARPVTREENWKCNWCKFFGNECKVWST
ncbi:MAG: PD-(D/E)XK nuclease family protein [Candidatus Micrarchaeota archaeon]|nr:PD-(D/E)XK nuclease family protein [Candidatus Micrarchaeota archaeon]